MPKIELAHVQRFKDRHGRLRHYFRKPGCKRVALPGEVGSREFMEAYQAALETRSEGAGKSRPGSISALIAAFYLSSAFTTKHEQTQRGYRSTLERFRNDYGDLPASQMQKVHLQKVFDKMADRPGAVRGLLKRLRLVYDFGMERGLVSTNPAREIKPPREGKGFRAWTEDDIEKFEAHWPAGSRARLALRLLLYTGQRRSDVVRMGRQHIRDGRLHVVQVKGGERVELDIRIHPVLKAELDALPAGMTFLVTAWGKPFTPAGFTNWMHDCAVAAGLPARSGPHGLRKAASRRLAEAGCSSLEIASITGHSSLREVERYTKSAAQAKLADAAMDRLETAGERGLSTQTVKPKKSSSKTKASMG